MKLCICFVTILGCSQALPSPLQEPLVWKNIKGKNVYVEPISNYTVDAPTGGRIIGGSTVTPNSVPYQVALIIDNRSFCGGSLISRYFVLSAAHCTYSASFVQLIFGAHNVQATEATQVRVTSTRIINHGYFTPSSVQNDISLINIPTAIPITDSIKVATLASSWVGDLVGYRSLLTGWGYTSDSSTSLSPTLQGVEVLTVNNSLCASFYGDEIQDSIICTSGQDIEGACSGDSGGPLAILGVQIGVVSFVSSRGCEAGYPTGFTRVSHFGTWISDNSDVSL